MSLIQEHTGRVLSTLEKDGSRRWLKPRVSKGRFLTARTWAAWFLIVLFFALPFIKINGHPAMLFDITARRFHLFGYTFLPTDTILLALAMLTIFVLIFLFTAILGRLWCGWACPQTVYLEFLYRPLERLFEGTAGKGGPAKKDLAAWRKPAYYVAALIVTLIPVHTFLAYWVGVDNLSTWVRGSPFKHPIAFLVMAVTTALMMFNFVWFREQLCIIACPYGRFQSVLLDKWSMIVSYDRRRGEPRGRGAKGTTIALPLVQGGGEVRTGDCVDCNLCVTTCPTGIDIRDGLQLECVNCTQCIDACDAVMDKLKRPRGLIRYSSQAIIDGEQQKRIRPRVIFYPLILCILIGAWITVFMKKGVADVTILRGPGNPFMLLDNGLVANGLKIKIQNRTDAAADYRFELLEVPGGKIVAGSNPMTVPGDQAVTQPFVVEVPPKVFAPLGVYDVRLKVTGKDFEKVLTYRLLGPSGPVSTATTSAATTEASGAKP